MRSTNGIRVSGLELEALTTLWTTRVDHLGNAVEPFVDEEGGWPLRCCLIDSRPGDEIAIVAWSPFPWDGPFAEVGPIVVHADPCRGNQWAGVPPQFEQRRQLLRPYTRQRRIAYDAVRIVEPDESLESALAELLAREEVELVHARNVLAGCYSFTAVLRHR